MAGDAPVAATAPGADGLGPAAADVLAGTCAAVVLVRADGSLVAANAAAARVLRTGVDEVVGRDAATLLARPREATQLRQALRQVARSGAAAVHQTGSGSPGREGSTSMVWALSRVPGPEPLVAAIGIDISATISATHSQLEDLQTRALTDELTGLANRTQLLRTLRRLEGTGATVVFCDLNGFKAVNDTHGHAAGDAVLVEVARRFVRAVRGDDTVFRLGGDEFVVVAPADPGADPEGLRRRVVGALRQPMVLSGGLVVLVGVAVGLARLEPGVDAATVLQRADAEMYGTKPSRTSRAGLVAAPG